MSDLKKRFGSRLRYLRRERDLTQEELAEFAEISIDFLSLIERGKSTPSFDTLEKLATVLDVPVSSLFEFKK